MKIPTLIYSRVSGYYNPTVNFNKGKREEFSERKTLNLKEVIKCLKK
jgi:anaerobic ribonucleoside-triphosphate reductase